MSSPLAERLHGIIPPVITPFHADGSFDENSARRLYQFMLDCGVQGLFLFGSSGEGPLLRQDVRERALQLAVDVCGGRVPVLAGVIAAGTDLVIEQARAAQRLGADAVVVCPPIYFFATPRDVLAHYRMIRSAVDVPLFAYDIPVTTKVKLGLETLLELAGDGTLIGVKDSSGDQVTFRRLLVRRPPGFRMFTGSELMVDSVLLQGADGCVPGLANVAPELFARLYERWQAGAQAEAAEIQNRITRLFEVFVPPGGGSDVGYALGSMKASLVLRGVIECDRLCAPFAAVTDEHRHRVRGLMVEAGLIDG